MVSSCVFPLQVYLHFCLGNQIGAKFWQGKKTTMIAFLNSFSLSNFLERKKSKVVCSIRAIQNKLLKSSIRLVLHFDKRVFWTCNFSFFKIQHPMSFPNTIFWLSICFSFKKSHIVISKNVAILRPRLIFVKLSLKNMASMAMEITKELTNNNSRESTFTSTRLVAASTYQELS